MWMLSPLSGFLMRVTSRSMGRATLLVIDDEPAITALVSRVAESCGYDVFATSDPDTFKQQFAEHRADLVCLDLAMPNVDGIELMRFLASQNYPSKLLIMSGSDPQLLQSALRLGQALGLSIAGTVAKPLRIDALRELLTSLRQSP
jgi:CheY-like chemotaxis protein